MDNQGRGGYSESRVERAASRAAENGGGDDAVYRAAKDEFGEASEAVKQAIREQIRRALG